jgi:predicted RND superfamily exporter protein
VGRIDDKVSNGLASISIWCSRHAKAVVAVAFVLTVVLGYGVSTITTNVDVADVLPRGNPNTDAAHNLTARFRSTFTQQVTFQIHVDNATGFAQWRHDNARLQYRQTTLLAPGSGVDLPVPIPGKVGPQTIKVDPDPTNITDEVYVRAMDEMVHYIEGHTDFTRAISISNLYALINWTVAGGQQAVGGAPPEAFALPGYGTQQDEQRYLVVDQTVKGSILSTVDAITAPKWDHAATLFMPASDNTKPTRDLGLEMIQWRDAYVKAVGDCIKEDKGPGETCSNGIQFTVFGPENPPLFTVDLPIANAHSSQLVQKDTVRLMPMVAAFILVCLYVAFRNVRAIVVSFTTLAVGVVWSYGTMGYLHIALNTLNMTIVPLVIGVGIDYAIHIINEFVEHKAEGHSDAEAFRIAGARSGVSMLIATATTIGGLATLIVSPSLLIAQLGLIATVALTVIYFLAITFVPAALTLIGGSDKMGHEFRRSRLMPALARGISKTRYLMVLVLVGVSVLAYAGTANLHKEAFGDPGRNYLPSDPIRKEHERGLEYFYGSSSSDEKANILTFSGPGILTPQAMDYYRTIEANLKTKERVIPDTLRTLPFFIETWLTVKNGGAGAAQNVALQQLIASGQLPSSFARQADPFPKTEEGIRHEIDLMFSSPMKELASIIVNYPTVLKEPDKGVAAMTFSVRAGTYDEASQVWDQVWAAVAEANTTFGGHAPPGITVAFIGNTATNYLFIADELPWLTYMNIVDNIMLVVLVFGMTRSVKTTFVTLVLSGLTSLWWLAILPFFGIGLAITLVLPMAFIIAIGTDYGIHFMWNIKQTGNAREVFESTGKAVLFSAITVTGAFTFFILVQDVAVSRTMIATTLSFAVIFVVTLLTVPIFFKVHRKGWHPPDAQPMATPTGPLVAPRRKKEA